MKGLPKEELTLKNVRIVFRDLFYKHEKDKVYNRKDVSVIFKDEELPSGWAEYPEGDIPNTISNMRTIIKL